MNRTGRDPAVSILTRCWFTECAASMIEAKMDRLVDLDGAVYVPARDPAVALAEAGHNLSPAEALSRLRAQISLEEKRAYAGHHY